MKIDRAISDNIRLYDIINNMNLFIRHLKIIYYLISIYFDHTRLIYIKLSYFIFIHRIKANYNNQNMIVIIYYFGKIFDKIIFNMIYYI